MTNQSRVLKLLTNQSMVLKLVTNQSRVLPERGGGGASKHWEELLGAGVLGLWRGVDGEAGAADLGSAGRGLAPTHRDIHHVVVEALLLDLH